MGVVEELTDRRPVVDHDGRSGARIETARYRRRRVYVKTAPADDVVALVVGNGHIEHDLFHSGHLHRLPPEVTTALIAVEQTDDGIVTVSEDVGRSILSWDRCLSVADVGAIFAGVRAVHRSGLPRGVDLCPLDVRLALFAPERVDLMVDRGLPLGAAVRRGQELFGDLVPADVAAAVARTYDDPAPLAAALVADGATLLHGDVWLANIGLGRRRVTLLDWGLATAGPPSVDLLTFCVGATGNVATDRAGLLSRARAACRGQVSDDVFALTTFWVLVELGWNKALDAVEARTPAVRARAAEDLGFWLDHGRRALDRGLLPM